MSGARVTVVSVPHRVGSVDWGIAVADAVIKNVRKDRNGDIAHVGVKGQWDWTVAQVLSSIESRTNTFYVNCPQRADVFVAQTPAGRKFLKTTADTTTKNNLDNLPPL